MIDLPSQTILITGAGRGRGRASALALARAGARLIAVDINPDSVQRTADEITAAGGRAAAHTVDVSNKLAVQTLHYSLLEAREHIGVVINAAHVTPASNALKLDEWEWNRTLDVNLKGAFLVSQTMARAMVETGGGLIFNLVRPASASAHAAVRAAREGLLGLTAALAEEWGALGVRVTAIESPDALSAAAEVVRYCSATD